MALPTIGASKGEAMMAAVGVTTITTTIEGRGTFTEMDTEDTKDTTSLTISVVEADTTGTDRLTLSQATIRQDTIQTMGASTKMVGGASVGGPTNATTGHVAVLGAVCRTTTTTAGSTDSRVTCGTRNRKGGTAVGAEARSDMKHGY